jgi:ribonuclease P protein subunit RPR2
MAKGGFPIREIVYERIGILLSLAADALRKKDERHAKRYVFLARKLSTRYNCRLQPRERAKFCKGCSLPLVPGLNATVRLRKRTKSAEYLCSCGRAVRLKY